MNVLDEILAILSIGAGLAQAINSKDIQSAGAMAGSLLAIAQKSVAALEAHIGQPVDLSLLHSIRSGGLDPHWVLRKTVAEPDASSFAEIRTKELAPE